MAYLENAETLLKLALRALEAAEREHSTPEIEDAIAFLTDDVIPAVKVAIQEQTDDDIQSDSYAKHCLAESWQGRFV